MTWRLRVGKEALPGDLKGQNYFHNNAKKDTICLVHSHSDGYHNVCLHGFVFNIFSVPIFGKVNTDTYSPRKQKLFEDHQ